MGHVEGRRCNVASVQMFSAEKCLLTAFLSMASTKQDKGVRKRCNRCLAALLLLQVWSKLIELRNQGLISDLTDDCF